MIGRADIEESKSNVDMNSWLPQASYPCFSISVIMYNVVEYKKVSINAKECFKNQTNAKDRQYNAGYAKLN